MSSLAIVIPAYKKEYFDEALQSLACQTNKNFTVYIGDDSSPEDLRSVIARYTKSINIVYHRFDENLGGKDLVRHWERCVSLKGAEEWLWLFSDDDVAEAGCVEAFYAALQKTGDYYDVFRFNTAVINSKSEFLSEAPPSPEHENAIALAFNLLMRRRGNSMPDHIFKSEKYKQLGGFINTTFAQGADWATSINYSYNKGLYTISGPKVLWRYSGSNVSSIARKKKGEMIFGHLQFIKWVNERFVKKDEVKGGISLEDIKAASYYNLWNVIETHYCGVPIKNILPVSIDIRKIFQKPLIPILLNCLEINRKVKLISVRRRLRPLKLQLRTRFQ